MTLYDEFIEDVEWRPDNHNRLVQLAVSRHLTDLKNKDFPYIFDRSKADRAIQIIKLLKHTQGKYGGKHFDLQPFQAFIVAMLFGWVSKETGYRRFVKAYLEMARKAGKSEFAGAIQILMCFFDNEIKPQVYTAATKSDQAEYVYAAAKSMCKRLAEDSVSFSQRLRVMQYEIKELITDGYITKMTSDSKTEDGANPHCAVVDEYHAHKDDGIVKVIETGMGSRTQPLLLIITTAGFDKFGPCYQFRQVVCNILEGVVKNDSVFGCIWTLDDPEEMHDETKWVKANPNIGKTPRWEMMRTFYNAATTEGNSALVEFQTKNLNMWVDSASVWIQDADWMKCEDHVKDEALRAQRCIIGIDLSSRRDLTAVCYYFPDLNYFRIQFYCPDEKIKEGRRPDGVDYFDFMKAGTLTATPGNTIDYDVIIKDIINKSYEYNVHLIAYDPYNADLIIPRFEAEGLKCGAVRQGYLSLSPPTKRLEKMILDRTIKHEGCPIMRWNISNVTTEMDSAGNIKASKDKSKNKIDGVSALVTAIGGHMFTEINQEDVITLNDIKKMYG